MNCLTYFLFIAIFILKWNVNAKSTTPVCSITLPKDIPKNNPLYLVKSNGNYEVFQPTGQSTRISNSNHLYLFCAGRNNQLKIGQKLFNKTLKLTCTGTNRFTSEIGELFLQNANCTKSVSPDIETAKCGHDLTATRYTIGYKMLAANFIALYDVCFDSLAVSVVWTKHIINGRALKYSVKENDRKEFKTTGIGTNNIGLLNSYKKAEQFKHFAETLGSHQIQFNERHHLQRGHMTPDADFIFPNEQFATYFYINVSPMFRSINAGNWLRIEFLTRKLATINNGDLTIYTGIYDQLQYPNERNQLQPLYLTDRSKIPVPKWIWKVIKNDLTESAVVIITLNDPHNEATNSIEFCPNVCDRANLNSQHFQNVLKGYTFCCELSEFRKVVTSLPTELHAKHLLTLSRLDA